MGVMDEQARLTFKTGVTIMGTDEQQTMLDTKAVKILKDETCGLEVISIIPSDELTRKMYNHQNKRTASKIDLEPLGKLVCQTWNNADFNDYDLPKDKYPSGRLPAKTTGQQYEFWVEDGVLDDCFVGMKLEARIMMLEGGIAILDEVQQAMCSFYKWLPNELLMDHGIAKEVVFKKLNLDDKEPVNNEVGGQKEKAADDEWFED